MALPAKRAQFVERTFNKHEINSLITRDHNSLDLCLYKDYSKYSIGGGIREHNEVSEHSETTKNINTSMDEDVNNRREEIEASIESLEFKALLILNDDSNLLKL